MRSGDQMPGEFHQAEKVCEQHDSVHHADDLQPERNRRHQLDPNGTANTTFTYGSAGACGPFPSQTKVTAGSITLTTSDTYYCAGAVRKSHADANDQITSASYTTDQYFWRP